ncbi:hypothetical protein [Cellulomonas endophytica]|uniref:hypothetical protein n=1 Tax=Cellulomonas endophytica TaxID=2494735 RepID=UPI0010121DD6|nr:hypothetical protein [Cellulomonas endophytica]
MPFRRPLSNVRRPLGALGLATAVLAALVVGPAASAEAATSTVDLRVLTKKWVGAGSTYVLDLSGSLPSSTTSAKLVVAASGAASRTTVAMCAGSSVTSGCASSPIVTAPAGGGTVYGERTIDLSSAGRKVAFKPASSGVNLTVRLESYTASTTSAPAPAPAPSTGSTTWPGDANTGVPSGTSLRVHEGDLKVTTAGTVIDGREIRGTVWVQAPGVVIKNSKITGRSYSSDLALVMVQGSGSVTIQDSEMYGRVPSPHVRGVIGQNFKLLRVDMHDVIDHMVITGSNVTVQDSWLRDNLYYSSDPNYGGTPTHDDNFQISAGSNINIIHNRLSGTHNASLMITQDRGDVSNVNFSNNHVSDGGCAVNIAQKAYGPISGMKIQNNTFTRTQIHGGCAMIIDSGTIPLLSQYGNRWSDGTAVKIISR